MILKSGNHYWWREKISNHIGSWKVGYVGEDPENNLWFHMIGTNTAIHICKEFTDHREFKKIRSPK